MKFQTIANLTAEYRASLLTRFMSKVFKPDGRSGCWVWTGATNKKGYGSILVNGRLQLAHRVSYELFKGPIGSLFACHSCDNPSCVNPHHLFAGDASDNMQDASQKGRLRITARKLDNRIVRYLRTNYDPGSHTVEMWANRLNVSTASASYALRGLTYKNAGGPIHTDLRGNGIDDSLFPKIKRMYQNGISGMKIADILQIDKSSVYRILKDQQRVNAG